MKEDARLGTIIFGGLDRAKFTGPLTALPIVPGLEYDNKTFIADLQVTLDGIFIKNGDKVIKLTANT